LPDARRHQHGGRHGHPHEHHRGHPRRPDRRQPDGPLPHHPEPAVRQRPLGPARPGHRRPHAERQRRLVFHERPAARRGHDGPHRVSRRRPAATPTRRRRMTRSRPHPRRRRGATMVETALVISCCLLFVFGIFEYGRYLMMRNLLEQAVQEGAPYPVVSTADVTTAQVQDRVHNLLAGQTTHLPGYDKTTSITVYRADAAGNNLGAWTDAPFGEYIAVRITGTYRPLLPSFLFLNATLPIDVRSFMYSEAN